VGDLKAHMLRLSIRDPPKVKQGLGGRIGVLQLRVNSQFVIDPIAITALLGPYFRRFFCPLSVQRYSGYIGKRTQAARSRRMIWRKS